MAKPFYTVKHCRLGTDAAARIGYWQNMTKETDAQAKARAERLAAALRANLRKRKGLGDRADPLEDQHPSPKAADPLEDQHPSPKAADPLEDQQPSPIAGDPARSQHPAPEPKPD